ncbi:MAG: acyl-CoA dehydrogenase family protein [Maricaulaceae bacterium]
MSDLKQEVESWLDANWDSENRCERGTEAYDQKSWLTKVVDAGYAVPTWPEKWYGRGLSPKEGRIIETAFQSRKAEGWGRDRFHLGAITIFKLGNEALKTELLHKLLSGPFCCLLYSEPNAGSDLAGIRTRAVKDGDEFIVNGQKVWTSNAVESEYGMLLARTDIDVPKHQGITFFIFPMKQDGVDVRPINQITGESEFNEVFIEDARVPECFIIGELNQGWKSFQTAIASERLIMGQGITARLRGAAGKVPTLLALAHKHDKLKDPVLRQEIAQALAYRQLNTLNMMRAKEEVMRNGTSSLASLGKLAMSRIQHGEARLSAKIVGPNVLLDDTEDARNANFDAAKAYMNSIGGGTDQIQKNIIAERVLGLPKSTDVSRSIPFKDMKSG